MAHHEPLQPDAQDRPGPDAEDRHVQEGRDLRPDDLQDQDDLHGLAAGLHGAGLPADAVPLQLQVDVHFAGVLRFPLRVVEQVCAVCVSFFLCFLRALGVGNHTSWPSTRVAGASVMLATGLDCVLMDAKVGAGEEIFVQVKGGLRLSTYVEPLTAFLQHLMVISTTANAQESKRNCHCQNFR